MDPKIKIFKIMEMKMERKVQKTKKILWRKRLKD